MIWGESYAGVYVPTLAHVVANAEPPLPVHFLGFAAGNPCTADRYQERFMSMNPDFALNAGLIDADLHAELSSPACAEACRPSWRLFDLLTSAVASQPAVMPGLGEGHGFLDPYDMSFVGSMNPYWTAAASYLNRADVRQALHVEKLPPWGLFASRLEYHKQYLACHDADAHPAKQYHDSVLPIYSELAGKGLSVLLYSGDEDPSVQWQGSLAAIRGLGIPEVEAGGWRPWLYNERPVDIELLKVKSREWGPKLSAVKGRDGPVLGGYVVEFRRTGHGTVTFATVRGVGHMVPQFQPQASLQLFQRTMDSAVEQLGAPPALAPPLPRTALEGTDAAFYGEGSKPGALGKWLEEAQSMAVANSDGQMLARVPSAGAVSVLAAAAMFATTVLAAAACRWRSRRTFASEPLL